MNQSNRTKRHMPNRNDRTVYRRTDQKVGQQAQYFCPSFEPHGGTRCDLIQLQMRHNENPGVVTNSENYVNRVARAGFTDACPQERLAA
jgi:hypothetical protein